MSNSTGAPAGEWIGHHYGGGKGGGGLSGSKAHHPGCGDHTAFLWVVQAVTISANMPVGLLVYNKEQLHMRHCSTTTPRCGSKHLWNLGKNCSSPPQDDDHLFPSSFSELFYV